MSGPGPLASRLSEDVVVYCPGCNLTPEDAEINVCSVCGDASGALRYGDVPASLRRLAKPVPGPVKQKEDR